VLFIEFELSECVKVEIKIQAITYKAVRKLRSMCQKEKCLPVYETVC